MFKLPPPPQQALKSQIWMVEGLQVWTFTISLLVFVRKMLVVESFSSKDDSTIVILFFSGGPAGHGLTKNSAMHGSIIAVLYRVRLQGEKRRSKVEREEKGTGRLALDRRGRGHRTKVPVMREAKNHG